MKQVGGAVPSPVEQVEGAEPSLVEHFEGAPPSPVQQVEGAAAPQSYLERAPYDPLRTPASGKTVIN